MLVADKYSKDVTRYSQRPTRDIITFVHCNPSTLLISQSAVAFSNDTSKLRVRIETWIAKTN